MASELLTAKAGAASLWQASLRRTDELFDLLSPAALYERPIPERHRLIFYLGHLEAFDWNLLVKRPSYRPELDKLFEFGIDPEPGRLPQDQPSDWPAEQTVREYVGWVRGTIERELADAPEELIHVAVEHRLMHAETLCYLLHNLPYDRKCGTSVLTDAPLPTAEWVDIAGGVTTLGRDPDEGFGWDNEFLKHTVEVPSFAVQKYKVTNGDYLRFVEQGGAVPHYWVRRGGEYFLRAMFAEVPLPLSHPVYVTQEQAWAYAEWSGGALPSEAQWHRAAFGSDETREYPWGSEPPTSTRGNFDFHQWDTTSVTAHPAGNSASGVSGLLGNGWEWTSTIFGPFEGFAPRPFYPGYSANFFDNQHFVMKGGSPRTGAALLRRSFRNWFRPNYPYVYAGFRCVRSA